ncbi:ABSCISIC ACID-INSENSITIVE 5-like protein 2 isoform X2 [Setaria italica]|nr:ABSCISIC ACID-INSENSITIVE 5-like protein 2 isoform X2 [Setaria italica]
MIQAMASQAGGGGGGDAGSAQRGQIQGLARQGSLYSLTLDEVQNHLGEPLLSMNFDDLLKTVFPDGVDPNGPVIGKPDPASSLQRQGSIVMPPQLSKKTVDEVWKGIQDGPETSAREGGQHRRERQPTLGEMTLEDFLVKAGVVPEGLMRDSDDFLVNMDTVGSNVMVAGTSSLNPGAQLLQQYQQQALESQQPSLVGSYMAGQLAPQPLSVATGAMLDSMYSDGQITSPTLGAFSDPQTPGRKRGVSGEVVDKVIERRQKRMIKNRESAARSRARKQAYTNELENKVSLLEEENERLKKQKVLLSFSCSFCGGYSAKNISLCLHIKLSVLAKLLFFRWSSLLFYVNYLFISWFLFFLLVLNSYVMCYLTTTIDV